MVVFVTGAHGFLGRHIVRALDAAGHALRLGVHRETGAVAPGTRVPVDFARDIEASRWLPRLAGVDVVVNTVGILRETHAATFAALHRDAPRALFAACVDAGVRQVIQVSALGADDAARSRYHASKRDADRYLASLPIASAIVQPSLVYGPGGASARLFEALSTLPVLPLPGGGTQRVQPVHLDDLVAAVVGLVGRDTAPGTVVPVVGPEPLTLADYLQRLRAALGRRRARVVAVPMPLARFAASAAGALPGALVDRETLGMLERGNTADPAPLRALLGREPRAVDAFIAPEQAGATDARAVLAWLLPLLRLAIAFVWIWTGIVSMGLYPVDESRALLARLGVTGTLATLLLYGAALLDLGLGVAALAVRRRLWVWRAQIAVIVGYTLLVSAWLPEYWLHPYGPITKNLPLIVATWLVATLEARDEASRWTT
jgi:uncharacterized protein YbjT (DUF2867 family)